MSESPLPAVERQIRRVSRRLFWQTLVDHLLLCWAGALAVVAVCFLVRPFVLSQPLGGWGWAFAGTALAAGSLFALVLAWLRSPGRLSAALALDERFNLKERVTTFLTLTAAQADSPAGQALVADVRHRVGAVDVAGRFPVRLRWSSLLPPLGAAVLAIAASFFNPSWSWATPDSTLDPNATANAQEIQNQLDNLKKTTFTNKMEDLLKDEKFKELKEEWEKLIQKPIDPNNKEQVRDRLKDMQDLNDKLKDRLQNLKGLADRQKDLKKELEKLAALDGKKKLQEGPAKELQDALAKGRLDKAQEALEKLQKALEKNELSKEDLKKLADQFKELKDRLQELKDRKEEREKLQRDFEQGKINEEELKRELDRLNEEADNLPELDELADLLDQCRECMGKGGKMAAGKLKMLRAKLMEIELSDDELRELMENAERLEVARELMLQALG
jgi:tetratricopeptide (TPR) repeat protein